MVRLTISTEAQEIPHGHCPGKGEKGFARPFNRMTMHADVARVEASAPSHDGAAPPQKSHEDGIEVPTTSHAQPSVKASRGGLYYRDPGGKVQGPFTKEHIQVCPSGDLGLPLGIWCDSKTNAMC